MWRQAGTLRRQMLGEQVLFAEAAPRPVGEMIERQPAPQPEPPVQPKLNRAQRRRLEKLKKAKPAKTQPRPAAAEESPEAFRARAAKTFAATFAAAPPQVRAAVARMTPGQRQALVDGCWPQEDGAEETSQGP